MSASDHLSEQFKPVGDMLRPAAEYPTKGYLKKTDRITAQQRMMGASRGYDAVADAHRKGITPSMN